MDGLDVKVTAHGDIGHSTKRYVRSKIARTARFVRDPILFARVMLLVEPDPARKRPALAKAELDVDGVMVRAHALGENLHEAVDILAERLRDELEHLTERRYQLRKRGPQPRQPHEWRHGDPPTVRPPYFDRPVEQRQVVRRKAYALQPLTAEEAVNEMQRMAYDFHLFVCRDTGAVSVVARRPDGKFDITSVGTVPPAEDWLVPAVALAPTLTETDARRRLDATGEPFLLFTDAATAVASVLYHRYDGHYGLITDGVAVVATTPTAASAAG